MLCGLELKWPGADHALLTSPMDDLDVDEHPQPTFFSCAALGNGIGAAVPHVPGPSVPGKYGGAAAP